MKPFIEPSYSKGFQEEDSEEIEEDSEDDDGDEEEEEEEIEEEEEENHLDELERSENEEENEESHQQFKRNKAKVFTSSQNGSTSSGTLGLYSSFDNIIGRSIKNKSPEHSSYYENAKLEEHDISSHLKGALSFGLPSKGNALHINRPYRILKKRAKFLQSRSRKSSRGRGGRMFSNRGSVNSMKKADLLKAVEKKMERENIDHLDEDLKVAYRIVVELMGDTLKSFNSVFLETIELDPKVNGDYLEVVKEPIWLPKVKEKLLNGEYKSITEVISQIRLMLENTYRYFGASHSFSRRGIRLEYVLEQKIAVLPKDLKAKCSLEVTHGVSEEEFLDKMRTKSASITVNGENYFSYLLYKVRGCRQAREKERKRKRIDLMRQAKLSKENELLTWDENLMQGSLGGSVRNMWELVQLNQFLYLSQKVLNITEISQYEIERILSMPEASLTLRMLMTSLVTPRQQRAKIADKPHMPYSVWARSLANKTFHWYRVYSKESHNPDRVFEQLGIEPKFWLVCGEENPFRNRLFHEMTLYQRVWILKALCDYIAHTHKSVQEAIAEQAEEKMREIVLGKDVEGNEYIHFPHLVGTDLRVYKRTPYKYSSYETNGAEEKKGKNRIFSKEQIKSFKKLIKKLKRNRERDEDWEYEQYKQKSRLPKKRGRKPNRLTPPSTPAPEKRTRPERLRQTPKPRYNFFAEMDDDIEDSSEENLVKYSYSRRRKRKEDSEEEEEEESEESTSEDEEEEEEKLKETEEGEDKKEKMPKKRKRGGKSHICKTCGKSFSSKSAMYGHTASHVRKKEKDSTIDKEETSSKEVKEEKDENVEIVKDALKVEVEEKGDDVHDDLLSKKTSIAESEKLSKSIKVEDEKSEVSEDEKVEAKLEVSENWKVERDSPLSTEVNPKEEEKMESKENSRDSSSEPNVKEVNGVCEDKTDGSESVKAKSVQEEKEGISKDEEPSRSETPSEDTNGCDNESSSAGTTVETPSSEPDSKEFELIVASFAELRNLIQKFGSLPPKYAKERRALQEREEEDEDEGKEDEEEKDDQNEDEEDEEKSGDQNSGDKDASYPKCEQKLHRALCKLLIQLAPFEGKMNAFQRQLRRKLWNEYYDWSKRDAAFVDPSEEAWKSDPDPEPTPSATQTPKQSSSSSSSEETYNIDGTRKRKLRKRKVKRPPPDPPSPPAIQESRSNVSSPVNDPEEDMITVSSRGRVRKVKKIVNYDRLDFDKLAKQAEKEAEKEKEQRKKKREEEAGREKALQEAAHSLQIPSAGVKRYMISKEGEVVGYIGNDGQVHSGHVKLKESEQSLKQHHQQQHPSTLGKNDQNPKKEEKTPKVVVSALNDVGNLVYVRMVGNQALELMKLIESSKNDPPRQIKLQRFSQTYTFNTNSYVLTQNIPGYKDCDTTNPQFLSKALSAASPKINTSVSAPLPIKTSAGPIVPSLEKIGSASTPTCKSPNPVALAYQGLPSSTNSQTSQNSTCASLSHSTNLVFASPSAVPSVPPMTASSTTKLPVAVPTSSVSSPLLVQTENGQHIQIGLSSDRLSQLVQKAGQRVVAVPNDKGGYTLSLISTVNSQGSSKAPLVSASGNVQKPVITQLVPTVVSAGNLIKGRIQSQQQQQTLVQAAAAVPSQQVVSHYTVNSPVGNSSSTIGRQVVIQQHPNQNATPGNIFNSPPTQPQQQQVVHLGQPSVLPQSQQSILQIQQQPQKVMQVVHSSGGRPVVQMIQPGQVLVSGSNIVNSVSSMQQHQASGIVVNSPQTISCHKQPTVIQPQVVLQQSPHPSKIIQVAHLDQFTQQQQQQQQQQQLQFQEQSQAQPQQIIIQPQQHYIVQQPQQQQQQQQQQQLQQQVHQQPLLQQQPQPQQQQQQLQQPQQHDQKALQQAQTLVTKAAPPQVQQREETPVQQQQFMQSVSQLSSATKVQTKKVSADNHSVPVQGNNAQVTQTTTDGSNKQVGRLVLLQMNDGQKVYLQLPDGRLSMLSSEQLQPLIKSGVVKLTS